ELPRRVETAARQLEQLLVARPRCVAGARRAGASAAGDALGAAVRREPLHPDRRARRRLRGSRLARPARPGECVGHVALVAARGLTDVDDAWLRYTLALPPAGTAQSGLAAEVDQVEADFERSGCPRP